MAELAGMRPRPSRVSTSRHNFRGSDSFASSSPCQKSVHLRRRSSLATLVVPHSPSSISLGDGDGGAGDNDSISYSHSSYCTTISCGVPYARSSRRVRRLASRHSVSNQGSDGRCRRTNWCTGMSWSSTWFNSPAYSAAKSSISAGQSSGRQSLDVDRADRNSSMSRRRHGRERTITRVDESRTTLTSQRSRPERPTSSTATLHA